MPQPERSVRRSGKGLVYLLRNLQRNQLRPLPLVNVKDDRTGDCVENVYGGQAAVRVQQHLQGERHVYQAKPPRDLEGINPNSLRRALGQQGSTRHVLRAARRVVGNLVGGSFQAQRPMRKEVARDDLVFNHDRRILCHTRHDDLSQARLACLGVVPELIKRLGIQRSHVQFPLVHCRTPQISGAFGVRCICLFGSILVIAGLLLHGRAFVEPAHPCAALRSP